MALIDIVIFVVYMLLMLGIGYYFLKRNKDNEDYYVGGRSMGSGHIGLSVVATDVGGGFSIGLGGLGFSLGISGSWMLFTGLLGAWLSAVFLIPTIHKLGESKRLFTFPQIFQHFYNEKVALVAGIISAIGYIGFTSSQILAGAKLASASFDGLSFNGALIIMGAVAVIYTVMGGFKAVVYTDTVQWAILMGGLVFIGIPMGYQSVGGYESIKEYLKPEMLSLTSISPVTFINWLVTIIPIWFVGMTLYQRIYACRDVKTAQRAWFLAGLFEYPVMAFMGVILGMFAKVALMRGMFEADGIMDISHMDNEMGLPMLLKNILPAGLMGLMLSAYFSAIMSTADSCLMAASGNVVTDIIGRITKVSQHQELKISQVVTLMIGGVSILLASSIQNVLELMLMSYSFMVAGLLVPVLAGVFHKTSTSTAAIVSMFVGGGFTIFLTFKKISLPYGLDPIIFGLLLSVSSYFIAHMAIKSKT